MPEAPVFVLSSGRSGSTLVQRLLNCHTELVVWGEHFGFLASPLAALTHMHNPAQRQYPRSAEDNRGRGRLVPVLADVAAPVEWANPCAMDEYAMRLRAFVEAYFAARLPPGRRWGFKEIRYSTTPVLTGLQLLYPQARFVFVQRDPLEATRSKIFAFVKASRWEGLTPAQQRRQIETILRELAAHCRVFDDFVAARPVVAMNLRYEALLADPECTMAALLGHLQLDPAGLDRGLAARVMGAVITTTPRDDALVNLIRDVQAAL